MTIRVALPPVDLDDGICLAEAARIVGCDQSTMRELVRLGQVKGWKVGKFRKGKAPTAVRVSAFSCLEYRDRFSCAEPGADKAAKKQRQPRRDRPSAAHLEAVAELRRRGIRV